jgi:hypothetical protein
MEKPTTFLYLTWDHVGHWGYWIYQDEPAEKGILGDTFVREYPVTREQYMPAQRRLGKASERLNDLGIVPKEDDPLKYFPSLAEIVG